MGEFISNFMNVVKNNYFNPNGRARRKEFWQYMAVYLVISIVLNILGMILISVMGSVGALLSSIISGVVSLGLLLPTITLSIRRMHDINKSGWFILIPLYNIYLATVEGDKGANQYGEDPKA